MNSWQISVNSGEERVEPSSGKIFVVYCIKIIPGPSPDYDADSWTIYKRYSEFSALHELIKVEHKSLFSRFKISFPKKTLLPSSSKKPEVIEERRSAFDYYLKCLLNDSIVSDWPHLWKFLNIPKSAIDSLKSKQNAKVIKKLSSGASRADVDELSAAISAGDFSSISSPDSLISLASGFIDSGRLDKAEEAYQTALLNDPKNPRLLHMFALFLEQHKFDFDDADFYYQKLVSIPGLDNAGVFHNYAHFLAHIRQVPDQAEKYYKKALELDPNNAETLNAYGTFLHTIRADLSAAESYYEAAIQVDSSHSLCLHNYASLSEQRGEMERADQFYASALKIEPDNVDILNNYAEFLRVYHSQATSGKSPLKATLPKKKTQKGHSSSAAAGGGGGGGGARRLSAFEEVGMRATQTKIEELYSHALAIEPNHPVILGNFASFLEQVLEDWEKAGDYYSRASLALSSGAPEASTLISAEQSSSLLSNYAIYLATRPYEPDSLGADGLFNRALKLDPKNEFTLKSYCDFLEFILNDTKSAQTYAEKLDEVWLQKHL